jgi:phenylpyruvate tautomerase PptA (4-oxalocrotonate tautomerase family)
MPIVDVELVYAADREPPQVSASVLASVMGTVFGSPPGRTWVRVHYLPSSAYAENDRELDLEALPVFVTVLQAQPPEGEVLAREVVEVTRSVAQCVARPMELVHVQYAPPAAGRQAFGGNLVASNK